MQQRNTRQKAMVLEAVRSRCDHPTADQIYTEVRSKDPTISRGTVYRNLSQLSENGQIHHVVLSGADRYDLRCDPHYHMICRSCGRVFDAPLSYQEAFDRLEDTKEGFQIEQHDLLFIGLCSHCAEGSAQEETER